MDENIWSEQGARVKGKVKWFDRKKGYGFITYGSGKDAFVYWKDIRPKQDREFLFLTEGQPVEFTPADKPKGVQALDVERLAA